MKEFLNYTLLQLGDYTIKVSSLLKLLIFLVIIFFLSRIIKNAMYRSKKIDLSKKYAIYSLAKYCILVFSFVIGLQIIGSNISVLIAGSAALLGWIRFRFTKPVQRFYFRDYFIGRFFRESE